jgi:2-phospho-L-lactate guanylyltransferase
MNGDRRRSKGCGLQRQEGSELLWVLLPVKRFAAGKSRLAEVLVEAERIELTCRMLADVLETLRGTPCIQGIRVLSNESRIDGLLTAAQIERLPEAHEGNVNESLMVAAAALPPSARRVLILPADVPNVSTADIEALRNAHVEGVVLSPAKVDAGTNALMSSLPLPIPLQFGPASLTRHLESARRRGVPVRVISRLGLAHDIDRPDDLLWLANAAKFGAAGAYVRELLRRTAECEAV